MSDLVKALRRYPKSEKVAHEAAARIEVLEALARGYDIARWMFTNRVKELEAALQSTATAIEALAFEMPPPNPYTPQFVMIANSARAALAPEQEN